MKNILFLSVCVFILSSCDKKDDEYLKDYLSDNGTTLNLTGTVGENELNEALYLPLFEDYLIESYIYEFDPVYNIKYQISIKRYTTDFQSSINFEIGLNEEYQWVEGQCHSKFRIIKPNNKILEIYNDFYISDSLIHNLTYNPDNGNLIFDYNFDINRGFDQDYKVEGHTDVILYKR